jgi:diguanylate cyclase (GGDEF)-like protein
MASTLEPGPARRTHLRGFLLQMAVVLAVFSAAALTAMFLRTQALLKDDVLAQSRSYVDPINAAREWNMNYGGAWVDKSTGAMTNPLLLKAGVTADIRTTEGRVLTLRNHAIMTDEIGGLLAGRGGVSLRLTGLRPLNPQNAPTAWERSSLIAFGRGVKERWTAEYDGPAPVFRYMRPLKTLPECLTCHKGQGFRVNDVHGALSVAVPLTAEVQTLRVNIIWLVTGGTASVALLLGVLYLVVGRMAGRLERAEASLMRLATTDSLTAVWNRRHTLEGLRKEVERAHRGNRSLAVVMADIDDVKRINDQFGHAAGDHVLAEIASRMSRTLRPYDILGRIGGEEFLVVAPEADLDGACALAERIRRAVSGRGIEYQSTVLGVSVSAGVTVVDPVEPEALDRALARADNALYESKRGGRDMVTAWRPGSNVPPETGAGNS